jgi:hypothetical protein
MRHNHQHDTTTSSSSMQQQQFNSRRRLNVSGSSSDNNDEQQLFDDSILKRSHSPVGSISISNDRHRRHISIMHAPAPNDGLLLFMYRVLHLFICV